MGRKAKNVEPATPAPPPEAFIPELLSGLTEREQEYLDSLSVEERLSYVNYLHQMHLKKCREDFLTFASYVGRDEETQQPLKQDKIHRTISNILDTHNRAVIFAHIGSGKTTQVAILRLLWEIGRCPTIRAGILSSNEENAGNRLARVVAYIEESAELKEVFPNLRPSTRSGDKWIANEQITVARPLGPQHPTVRAFGLHNSMLSWRCDLLIGDDILEFKHVITKHEREKVMKWFEMTILGRTPLTRVWLLGVPHHKEDLLHRMIKRGWPGYRIPVREKDGTLNSPNRCTPEWIAAKKEELGPAEAARQLEPLEARDNSQAKFKEEWVAKAIELGQGMKYPRTLDYLEDSEFPEGSVVVTGVDLAVSEKDTAAQTSFVTILVLPDKSRRILDVYSARIAGLDIAKKAVELHYRYNSHLVVESVAAQKFLIQMIVMLDPDVPVTPFETRGSNKWHPTFGVESIGGEMDAGRWAVANDNGKMPEEVYALLQEMLSFDPASHTGDRLMACWFAREGARRLGREGGGTMKSRTLNAGPSVAKASPAEPENAEADTRVLLADIMKELQGASRADLLVRAAGGMIDLNCLLTELQPGTAVVFGALGPHLIVRATGDPSLVVTRIHGARAQVEGVLQTTRAAA